MMKLDLQPFEERIADGRIRRQWHPSGELQILNYTQRTDYESLWDAYTELARGLILDTDGNIVSRSFKKFWNLNDERFPQTMTGNLPDEFPVITHKEDGYLAVSYTLHGITSLASRGSFTSEYARWATEWFYREDRIERRQQAISMWPEYTFVFEILYPHRRIVVDNSAQYGLVLLAMIRNETGRSVGGASHKDVLNVMGRLMDIPVVHHYNTHTLEDCIELQKSIKGTEQEGFVAYFPHADFRVKIKGEDYCRIHRICTRLTKRRIWEMLKAGDTEQLDSVREALPSVYRNWLEWQAASLTAAHRDRCVRAEAQVMTGGLFGENRKAFVESVRRKDPGIFSETMCLYDGNREKAEIVAWKALRPDHETPLISGHEDE